MTVESARTTGAEAFLVLPVNHASMTFDEEVIGQVLAFLRTGRFEGPGR